jgi:hypothetical protein
MKILKNFDPVSFIETAEKKCMKLDKKIDAMYSIYESFEPAKKRSLKGKMYLKKIHNNEEKILKLLKNSKITLSRLDFIQNLKKSK